MTIECSTYEFECIFLLIEWNGLGIKLNEKRKHLIKFAGKTYIIL